MTYLCHPYQILLIISVLMRVYHIHQGEWIRELDQQLYQFNKRHGLYPASLNVLEHWGTRMQCFAHCDYHLVTLGWYTYLRHRQWRMDGQYKMTDWRMDRQTSWWTGGRTDKRTDEWTDGQRNWRTDERTDGQRNWLTDGRTDRGTDWLTDELTNEQRNWRTDRRIDWLNACLSARLYAIMHLFNCLV